MPADGEVVDGTAAIDESMITGESTAVSRGPGAHVVAGTVATDTAIRVRVGAVGDDTALAGIQRLVAQAQASSSRAQRLADRAAGWLFWFALGAAVLTAIAWTLLGDPDDAVVRTITVLVIACPHALGLAIPLVVSIATERAARGGVLVTDRLALETMRTVGAVLFDKTGTLTKGEPAVTDAFAAPGFDPDQVMALAAAAEGDSEHPLAKAIVADAARRGLAVAAASGFTASAAIGVRATVDGRTVQVGGPGLLAREGAAAARGIRRAGAEAGQTVLHVLVDGEVAGAIALADEVRPESREAVDALHALGVQVVMITGDAEPVARSVAAKLGIDRVYAGVRPEDKSAKVQELQHEGLTRRDGRRRRERRAGARAGRCRHRDRRGHGCRDRLGRRHPRVIRPPLGDLGHRAVARELPQDVAEPVVGGRVQPDLGAARRGRARPDRVRAADVDRRDPDVALDDHRGGERAAAAPARPAARGVDPVGARSHALTR